jgi:hypothetical protein
VPTINASKRRWRPLAGADGDSGAPTINVKNVDGGTPWEVLTEIRELPPSMLKNVNDRSPSPRGGSGPHLRSERCAVTCIGMRDKK